MKNKTRGKAILFAKVIAVLSMAALLPACDEKGAEPEKTPSKFAGAYDLAGQYDWRHYCACTPMVVDKREGGSFAADVQIVDKPGTADTVVVKGLQVYNESLITLDNVSATISGDSILIPAQQPGELGLRIAIQGYGTVTEDSIFIQYNYIYRFIRCSHTLKGKR